MRQNSTVAHQLLCHEARRLHAGFPSGSGEHKNSNPYHVLKSWFHGVLLIPHERQEKALQCLGYILGAVCDEYKQDAAKARNVIDIIPRVHEHPHVAIDGPEALIDAYKSSLQGGYADYIVTTIV